MTDTAVPTPASQSVHEAFATRKVVVNRCRGGFGLSDAAVHAYAERKGLTLYPERDRIFTTWWLVPPEKRPAMLEGAAWHRATIEERQASNHAYDAATLSPRDIARDDADLVAVVEDLGDQADGEFASLEVVEVPADVQWQIEEYDGREWVAEKHRTW